jgi:hypothetical protein
MLDHISPEFHAEIIVVLFNDHKDPRKVSERTRILLSNASAKHIEAVARFLPEHLSLCFPVRCYKRHSCERLALWGCANAPMYALPDERADFI